MSDITVEQFDDAQLPLDNGDFIYAYQPTAPGRKDRKITYETTRIISSDRQKVR